MTFIFSCTSGVRQFYLVLWLLQINGCIEEPGMEEMASENVKHGDAVIDVSVLMERLCRSCSTGTLTAAGARVTLLKELFAELKSEVSFGSLNQHEI